MPQLSPKALCQRRLKPVLHMPGHICFNLHCRRRARVFHFGLSTCIIRAETWLRFYASTGAKMRYAKRLIPLGVVFAIVGSTLCLGGCITGGGQPSAAPAPPSESIPPEPAPSEPAASELPSSSEPSTPGQVAIVSRVFGDVLVMKAGTDTWSKASADMTLETGDHIKTGVFSRAVITFFEGSTIELKADTEVGVTDLSISEDTGSTVIRLWQQIGRTRSRVEKLVDPASRYEIETPAGAAVVRGSTVDTIVVKCITTVINVEGQVWAVGQGQEQPIPVGMQSTIVCGNVPSIPAQSLDLGALTGVGGGPGGGGSSDGGGQSPGPRSNIRL